MAAAADIIPCCEGGEVTSCGDEMVTTTGLFLCFFEGDATGGCVCFLLGGISGKEKYNSNEYKQRQLRLGK